MRITICGRMLLAGICMISGLTAWAQAPKAVQPPPVSGDLAVTFAVEHTQTAPMQSGFWLKGAGADAAVTFWKGLGLAASLTGDHAGAVSPGVDVNKLSYLAGPRYTWTAWQAGSAAGSRRLQIFGQGLFGGVHGFDGVYPATGGVVSSANSFALQAGGGFNYYLNKNWGLRLLEADFVRTQLPNGAANTQNDMRLAFGITYHLEAAVLPPVTLSCSASPASVFPGDPVMATAVAGNLDPKLHTVYSWSGSGVTGSGTSATVATASLAPGTYPVNCGVKEGKPGKEGLKPWETASGTAGITVKAFEPPTISCSASPSTINPGDKSAITAAGVSPQNRPLTYSYSAPSGTINGTGTSATYDSTGASPGDVPITCNVSDDKGHSATASALVTITAPPPPPPPAPTPEQIQLEARLALHSIFFPTDRPRIDNPDGGLVASQKGTLTTLATDFKRYLEIKPGARLTLSGHTDVRGSVAYNQALSERRVATTKQFLISLGVPEASIETRGLGKEQQLTTDQVKALINQNPDLSDAERSKVLHNLNVIVLAQNRRVDVSLNSTGQQSTQLYPFNATDAMTLISTKSPVPSKKAPEKKAKKGQ